MSDTQDSTNPMDVAEDANNRVNSMLADTNGKIAAMSYSGAIGYHINIAQGETDIEYLWRTALLQAFDETFMRRMFVDADDPVMARETVERQLKDYFDPFTAESLAESFEDNLRDLIERQEELAHSGGD